MAQGYTLEKNCRLTRPMLGFEDFQAAQRTLGNIEVMGRIRKGQMKTSARSHSTPADLFNALAA